MNFIKGQLYIDDRNKEIIVFDNVLLSTDSNTVKSDIYFFTEIETYSPRLYFGKEINHIKEY